MGRAQAQGREHLTRRGAVQRGALAVGMAAAIARIATPPAKAQDADGSPPPSGAPVPDDFKVVLHAAEVQHWGYVLSNLRNLTSEWPRAQLRVVVDGSAVTALQGENNLTSALGEMAAAGVTVQVCPNALREHSIKPETVPSFAQVSLGGVVAMVLAHNEGFVYVKP